MTVTAPLEPRRDAKGGFCGRCRNGQHTLCASPPGRCECPSKDHPNRPGAVAPTTPRAAGGTTVAPSGDAVQQVCGSCQRKQHTCCTKPACPCPFERHPNRRGGATKLREPLWQLVKAEPPAPPPPKPKKLTVVERARPFVEQLMAEGDRDWHRFAVFPSSMAAGQVRGRVAKAYAEFEFKAVRVTDIGQSALYGRWVGKRPRGQL